METVKLLESCGFAFSEVDDGEFFAGGLFRRKFASPPPPVGHHIVAMLKDAAGALHVAGYAHFHAFEDVMLVGGVCTDGDVMRRLSPELSRQAATAGGVYFNILKYAFAKFADQCNAYFGYCGDARAEVVNLSAGFSRTGHRYLLVNFHKPLDDRLRDALVGKVAAIGPF